MSTNTANLEVVNSAISTPFTNAADNDIALYPASSNQSIHIGCKTGATASSMVKVTNSNVEINTLTVSTLPTWSNMIFANGWTNYEAATFSSGQYTKDALGRVHLKGLIRSGTVGDVPIFNLPLGYRPTRATMVSCNSWSGTTAMMGDVRVKTNGDVILFTGGNGWLTLDGTSFWPQ